MGPVVQAMASKYGDKIRFIIADVNTDKGISLANEYKVMSIPAMFFIDKSGQVQDMTIGTMTSDDLENRLKNLLQ